MLCKYLLISYYYFHRYKVLYSAFGTGQISLGFRLSYGRQKWVKGSFLESEEKVQVTVPCTSGSHIHKFTTSFIGPHINTFIKSYIVHLCIFFLNQDLSFILFPSQTVSFSNVQFLLHYFAFFTSSQHQVTVQRTLYLKPDSLC